LASNRWLIVGGGLSLLAAALHLACIVGGPDWYRFFGAGEGIARAAARGSPQPAMFAFGIAAILIVWALYAFAGAGLLSWRPPLLRVGLAVISAIYLARGLLLIPLIAGGTVRLFRFRFGPMDAFHVWSSLIVFAYGVVYALGTWQAWRHD
jgi:hypothetical protein